jgi:hypothetical protein
MLSPSQQDLVLKELRKRNWWQPLRK